MYNFLKKTLRYLWIIPFAITALCVIQRGVPDSDTFFLAATGRYIVENGIVPVINPFVIHENFGIIVQQWLFDVLIYGIYGAWGNLGLYVFLATAYFVTMLMLYKYFGLYTQNTKAKTIILIISGILYLSFAVARPTIFSFPLLLTLLYCLEKYRSTNHKRYLAVMPLISLIQVNIHASMWPMMYVLMMPYIFPFTILRKGNIKDQFKTWFQRNKYILLTIVPMIGVGFLNPNGWKGMTYVLQSYGSATGGVQISELASPTLDSIWGITILAAVVCFSIYTYKIKEKFADETYDMQEEFTRLSMSAGVLILACMHIRNLWYLILGATPMVLLVLKNCKFKLRKKETEITLWNLVRINFVCVVLIAFFGYIMFSIGAYSQNTTIDSTLAPIVAADYLDQHKDEDIVLYTEFNNGAYMEWRGYQVYMDARPELFQKKINNKEDIYSEYCQVAKGSINYEEFLGKYNFTHLIVSQHTIFDMYLSLNPSYEATVSGNGYTLYQAVSNS